MLAALHKELAQAVVAQLVVRVVVGHLAELGDAVLQLTHGGFLQLFSGGSQSRARTTRPCEPPLNGTTSALPGPPAGRSRSRSCSSARRSRSAPPCTCRASS